LTVGIILEEPSADPFVKKIAEKLGIRVKTIVSKGRERMKKKLDAYASLLSKDCQKILALVDSHCSDSESVERNFVLPQIRTNVSICVVVHAIESWLLADPQAIARRIRSSRLRTHPNPEALCKPEEELDRIFELHGKKYLKGRDAEKIAEFVRPRILARKCPSFERFRDSLRHC